MINKDDLLPCPFCGEKSALIVKGTAIGESEKVKAYLPPGITCFNCNITLSGNVVMADEKPELTVYLSDKCMISMWNRRCYAKEKCGDENLAQNEAIGVFCKLNEFLKSVNDSLKSTLERLNSIKKHGENQNDK